MNLIRVEGTKEILLGLVDIPDLGLKARAGVELPDGNWAISAYASDQAITTVQARGCTVTVILANEQVEQKKQIALTEVGDGNSPA